MIEVLNDIPFELRPEKVMRLLRLRQPDSKLHRELEDLIQRASAIARPKAVYRCARVDSHGANNVCIDGVTFTSKVLRKNLDTVDHVYPHVVTCGLEVEALAFPGDVMKTFCMDAIKMMLVGIGGAYLISHLKRRFGLGQTSHMSPGSLPDWPLTQQKCLFSLLGDVEKLIGVRLTENMVMYPMKSSSGIIFPTEVAFESCQLCTQVKCPGRRVPYSPEAARKYLGP